MTGTSCARIGLALLCALSAGRAAADAMESSATVLTTPAAAADAAWLDDEDSTESAEHRPRYTAFRKFRPNYLISGLADEARGHTDVHYQVSIKYDVFDRAFGVPGLEEEVAYTQRSFWDLYAESSPFRDNNYNPESFLEYHLPAGAIKSVTLGYAHQSNGRAGAASRSWERIYAGCHLHAGPLEAYLTAWYPFGLSDNPDLLAYWGWGEVILRVHQPGWDVEWELTGRLGDRLDRGSLTLGVNGGIMFKSATPEDDRWFKPHLYAQLRSGWGETMLDYNRYTTSIRGGLMLRR